MCLAYYAVKITSSKMSSKVVLPAHKHYSYMLGPYLTMLSNKLRFKYNLALSLNNLDFSIDFNFSYNANLLLYLNSLLLSSYLQRIGLL